MDRLDLPGSGYAYSGAASGTLSTLSFDSDLAAGVSGLMTDAKDAVWFTATAGDLSGKAFLVVDANGIAGYQAGEDYVFEMVNTPAPLALDPGDFFI
jgi:hypothetical protein